MDPKSRNRRILLTGATGFIGSNLARRLIKDGYEVSIITRKSSNLWRIEDIKDRLRIFNASLENFEELDRAVSEIKPEIIFHLATYGGFSAQREADKIIDTDVIGTMNLFKACSKVGFSLFVNTGSSSEYGLKEHPMTEQDELTPITYYGASKAAMSLFFGRIAKSQNLNIVTLRPFAVYGYYEEKERLVPHIILSCLKNWEPRLSTPNSVRDFIFVEDVVDAYMATIEKKDLAGECFNIGSGQQHSIGELARLAIELSGKRLRAIYGTRPSTQVVEPLCWVADISKAEKLLGWKPKHSIRDGLTKTIDWFRKNTVLYED
jgi:nucleoside-diphosphate-sugar epimerase